MRQNEFEQCNTCGHVWQHEDDCCPDCGSQDTDEFNVKVKLKENWQQIKELEDGLNKIINLSESNWYQIEDIAKQALNQ